MIDTAHDVQREGLVEVWNANRSVRFGTNRTVELTSMYQTVSFQCPYTYGATTQVRYDGQEVIQDEYGPHEHRHNACPTALLREKSMLSL
jgi:hypothetical protein